MSSTITDTPDEPTVDKPVLTLSVTALAAGFGSKLPVL